MKKKAAMVMGLAIVTTMLSAGEVEAKINPSIFRESEVVEEEDIANIDVAQTQVTSEGIIAENGAVIPFEYSEQSSYSWETVTYTIQEDDCLWEIGEQYGIDLEELIELNSQIKNTDLIYPGQIINLYKVCKGYEASVQK